MADFKHKQKEQISRQQAAERLMALADALSTGGSLELDGDDHQVSVPVADQVLLEQENKSKGERLKIELELSWSTASPAPAPAATATTEL